MTIRFCRIALQLDAKENEHRLSPFWFSWERNEQGKNVNHRTGGTKVKFELVVHCTSARPITSLSPLFMRHWQTADSVIISHTKKPISASVIIWVGGFSAKLEKCNWTLTDTVHLFYVIPTKLNSSIYLVQSAVTYLKLFVMCMRSLFLTAKSIILRELIHCGHM